MMLGKASTRIALALVLSAALLSACKSTALNTGSRVGSTEQQATGKFGQQSPGLQEPHDSGNSPQLITRAAQQELASGIASFDNEDIKSSEKELLKALTIGLDNKNDQVLAHKYLAFIYCISHRKSRCHAEFRNALKLDPAFNLAPGEAGHPMWGPVFRSEKAKHEKSMLGHKEHKGHKTLAHPQQKDAPPLS